MILRLTCDSTQRVYGYAKDKRTLQPALLWRGNSLELQCGLFQAGVPLTSADVGMIVVELKLSPATGETVPEFRRNLFAVDCDETFTGQSDWFDGTKQLFTLQVSAEDLDDLDPGVYRLIVRHSELGLELVTFLTACIEIKGDKQSGSELSGSHLEIYEDGEIMYYEDGEPVLIEQWESQLESTLPEI